jgi:large-conductance mechanosensitive channel
MSLFIFGKILLNDDDSFSPQNRQFAKEVAVRAHATGLFVSLGGHSVNNPMLLEMLTLEDQHVKNKNWIPFFLIDSPIDDVSDYLFESTRFYTPNAEFIELTKVIKKLADFVCIAFAQGARSVDLLSSVGYSVKEDFKKIAATQNNLTEVLLKELRDTYEVPSLWITCKSLSSVRNA